MMLSKIETVSSRTLHSYFKKQNYLHFCLNFLKFLFNMHVLYLHHSSPPATPQLYLKFRASLF